MRELERSSPPTPGLTALAGSRLAIIGRGRLATALADALTGRVPHLSGPLGRDPDLSGADIVLLCVPDAAIAETAAGVPGHALVGHCSGATPLSALGLREGFSLHPLMSVPASSGAARLRGAAAGIAAGTPRALAVADSIARAAGMRPFTVAAEDRAAYHAAASVASNFLVTLEAAAERIAAGTGLSREQLAPLVRATVESWAELGPERALTGPIARGDEATVAAQRAAVAERAPELIELFDTLTTATRALAAETTVAV
ncbi:MAG TPA: DUF2520 domain-containing protein [Solirubrobacteraceae bacterium]|nr:DUF2520 domain-containing protein [Solirubrobacteraceae bacterium]